MSAEAHSDFGWRGLLAARASIVAAAMAEYEAMPATRRLRQREQRERDRRAVDAIAAEARAAIDAWHREGEVEALRARLDAMGCGPQVRTHCQ